MGAAFANIYITADGKSIPALYKKNLIWMYKLSDDCNRVWTNIPLTCNNYNHQLLSNTKNS